MSRSCSGCWQGTVRDANWNEKWARQSKVQRIEQALAIFACSREAAAALAESVGTSLQTETACNLLFNFCHAKIEFVLLLVE